MTLQLTFHNPITNNQDIICLIYPDVDYGYYLRHKNITNDKDICNALNTILYNMDCSVCYNNIQIISTRYPRYISLLSDWYYYFIKLNNNNIINIELNKLIECHVNNLVFECTKVLEVPKVKRNNIKKKKKVKAITHDLFTGERIDLEIDSKTGKEKIIKSKRIGVPIENMTFNFKKK